MYKLAKMFLIRLWTSSPSSLYSAIKKRVLYKHDWNYSIDQILNNPKHLNSSILIDRWERLYRVINQNIDNNNISKNFIDKTVFELGCGPLLGFGPIFIFLGAKTFYYYEPNISLKAVFSEEIKNLYFRKIYDELVSNYGKLMTFDFFYQSIKDNSLETSFKNTNTVDLVISNSVLEHIPMKTLGEMIKKIERITKSNSSFIHVVDFGFHSTFNPGFGDLYFENKKKYQRGLNFARTNDIESLLNSFQALNFKKYIYRRVSVDTDRIHSFWRNNYSKKDLEAIVVIYVSINDNH